MSIETENHVIKESKKSTWSSIITLAIVLLQAIADMFF